MIFMPVVFFEYLEKMDQQRVVISMKLIPPEDQRRDLSTSEDASKHHHTVKIIRSDVERKPKAKLRTETPNIFQEYENKKTGIDVYFRTNGKSDSTDEKAPRNGRECLYPNLECSLIEKSKNKYKTDEQHITLNVVKPRLFIDALIHTGGLRVILMRSRGRWLALPIHVYREEHGSKSNMFDDEDTHK